MAGPQHPFPPGFPTNAQQNNMRNQFGGGQMVSGLMGPQQGMVNPQQFGGGVGGVGGVGTVGGMGGVGVGGVASGINPNSLGMMNPQQVMGQPQPMQQHMQQQQQMHLQQQQQQNTLMPPNSQTGVAPPPQIPQAQQPSQRPATRDINTISLCKLGQENVQEIVSRVQDFFQNLKTLAPPNGTPQGQNVSMDRKKKVEDLLKNMGVLFKRLRVIYEKCNENCQLQGMEYTHIESLIPIKEEWSDMKSDEKKTSEAYKAACDEYKEVVDQIIIKNRHLKEIIESLRRIICEINAMMMMRRS